MYFLQQSIISQNSLAVGVHWFTMLTLGVGICDMAFNSHVFWQEPQGGFCIRKSIDTRTNPSFETCLSSVPISGCHDVETTLKFLSVFRLVLRMYVYVYTYIYIYIYMYVHVFRIMHIYVKHIKRQYLI